MIPLKLHIAGFLSYRDAVELDFDSFDLACISGQNGAGKSSLLDAITWVLFGEARTKDKDALVNLQSKAAEVTLTFAYESNFYRVQRTATKGKSTVLEFQIAELRDSILDNSKSGGSNNGLSNIAGWRPLTERSTRETQSRIEQTLRLDYDTFVNASFFLQGKADEFTQKKASERKAVLGNILGLEIWETYKERAAERRKEIEAAVGEIDGRIAEIDAELGEEETRKLRLKDTEATLKNLTSVRTTQEAALEQIRKAAAVLDEQRKSAQTLAAALDRSRSARAGLESRLAMKQAERATHADLVARAAEIESAHKEWQKARKDLEKWDKVAADFREHESARQPFLREIEAERVRLEQESLSLSDQFSVISNQLSVTDQLKEKLKTAQVALEQASLNVATRKQIEAELQAGREKQAELKAENETLRAAMLPMDERIKKLEVTTESKCPLCDQPLTPEHRLDTIERLKSEGKEMGDRFRSNKVEMEELAARLGELEKSMRQYANAESEQLTQSNAAAQLTERIESLERQSAEWEQTGAKRLKEVTKILKSGKFADEASKQLAKLDKELAKLGYDASAHDAVRQAEADGRSAEEELSNLKSARGVLKQIDDELANLNSEIRIRNSEIAEQEKQYEQTAKSLMQAEASAPNLDQAERDLLRLREQENQARDEVTRARQLVDVLASLSQRKKGYAAEREEQQQLIARHKMLERAFGKDGVPALLIEQALPQIEAKANDLLDRLSNGSMSLKFATQSEYKDKKRDDLKETLDIQISDGAGLRDYEMYSGGEAFRVNFAIRLALSEVLAGRKGARLQTLVIDEGFGSQDAQGRQRLIEAINLVKPDFAKILVITHLDELKDAFPSRIEVEKTERGSTVRVI
jgi:exonuclease SbcC